MEKELGEVILDACHATARLVKNAVFGRQHDHRDPGELGIAFDNGTRLVAIESRHQNVTKNQVGLVVIDLEQSVKAIFSQQNLMATLLEENFRTAPNGIAIVHHQHFESSILGTHKASLLS